MINTYHFPENKHPSFDATFFEGRRKALMAKYKEGDCVIVIGAKEHFRNSDVEYGFRQESPFYYLTGFQEPDSVAILQQKKFTLIVPPKDKMMEVWTGRRAGVNGAKERFRADEAYPNTALKQTIKSICKTAERVFIIPASTNPELTKKVTEEVQYNLSWGFDWGWIKALHYDSYTCKPFKTDKVLHKIRMIKTEEEIALLTRANEISSEAHIKAMKKCKRTDGSINECQIRAVLEKVFTERGAASVGYGSIVASGSNATILHYPHANQDAYPGDLVLIDAAAEYGNYTADITRTWPISGKFTEDQKAIYEIVLNAQNKVIDAVQPGVTIMDLHKISERVIIEGLVKLGIMKGDVAELCEDRERIQQFYPHTIGHYLGLDVHDVSPFPWQKGGKEVPLEVGMVITVEPGIYIQEEDETVAHRWRGIGVRIEDNILLTENGPKNLTLVPKTIEEIENLMA